MFIASPVKQEIQAPWCKNYGIKCRNKQYSKIAFIVPKIFRYFSRNDRKNDFLIRLSLKRDKLHDSRVIFAYSIYRVQNFFSADTAPHSIMHPPPARDHSLIRRWFHFRLFPGRLGGCFAQPDNMDACLQGFLLNFMHTSYDLNHHHKVNRYDHCIQDCSNEIDN